MDPEEQPIFLPGDPFMTSGGRFQLDIAWVYGIPAAAACWLYVCQSLIQSKGIFPLSSLSSCIWSKLQIAVSLRNTPNVCIIELLLVFLTYRSGLAWHLLCYSSAAPQQAGPLA